MSSDIVYDWSNTVVPFSPNTDSYITVDADTINPSIDIYPAPGGYIGQLSLSSYPYLPLSTQNITTIIVVDRSGSMGQHYTHAMNQHVPNMLLKMGYILTDSIYWLTFDSEIELRTLTVQELLDSSESCRGCTSMSGIFPKLVKILQPLKQGSFVRMLTISDGAIDDIRHTVTAAEDVSKIISRLQLNITSHAIRLFTSSYASPDTRALSSVLQLTTQTPPALVDITPDGTANMVEQFVDTFKNDGVTSIYLTVVSKNIQYPKPIDNNNNTKYPLINNMQLLNIPQNNIQSCLKLHPWENDTNRYIPILPPSRSINDSQFQKDGYIYRKTSHLFFIPHDAVVSLNTDLDDIDDDTTTNTTILDDKTIILPQFAINGTIPISQVEYHSLLDRQTYVDILESRLEYYSMQGKLYRLVGSDISIDKLKKMAEWFTLIEDELKNITSNNNISKLDIPITLNDRIRKMNDDIKKSRAELSMQLNQLVNQSDITRFNSSQAADFLRSVDGSGKNARKMVSRHGDDIDFDANIIQDIKNMVDNYNDIIDIDDSTHKRSYISHCTTLDGIKCIVDSYKDGSLNDNNINTMVILELINLVGIPITSVTGDYPDPYQYIISYTYPGESMYLSLSDIIAAKSLGMDTITLPGYRNTPITDVVPLFDDIKILHFLQKNAPHILAYHCSVGMRRILSEIPYDYQAQLSSSLLNLICMQSSKPSLLVVDSIKNVYTTLSSVSSYKSHIPQSIMIINAILPYIYADIKKNNETIKKPNKIPTITMGITQLLLPLIRWYNNPIKCLDTLDSLDTTNSDSPSTKTYDLGLYGKLTDEEKAQLRQIISSSSFNKYNHILMRGIYTYEVTTIVRRECRKMSNSTSYIENICEELSGITSDTIPKMSHDYIKQISPDNAADILQEYKNKYRLKCSKITPELLYKLSPVNRILLIPYLCQYIQSVNMMSSSSSDATTVQNTATTAHSSLMAIPNVFPFPILPKGTHHEYDTMLHVNNDNDDDNNNRWAVIARAAPAAFVADVAIDAPAAEQQQNISLWNKKTQLHLLQYYIDEYVTNNNSNITTTTVLPPLGNEYITYYENMMSTYGNICVAMQHAFFIKNFDDDQDTYQNGNVTIDILTAIQHITLFNAYQYMNKSSSSTNTDDDDDNTSPLDTFSLDLDTILSPLNTYFDIYQKKHYTRYYTAKNTAITRELTVLLINAIRDSTTLNETLQLFRTGITCDDYTLTIQPNTSIVPLLISILTNNTMILEPCPVIWNNNKDKDVINDDGSITFDTTDDPIVCIPRERDITRKIMTSSSSSQAIPLQLHKLAIILLGRAVIGDDITEPAWNNGNICIQGSLKKFSSIYHTTEYDPIVASIPEIASAAQNGHHGKHLWFQYVLPQYMSKRTCTYRDNNLPNRHAHTNDNKSYWALGYSTLQDFINHATQDEINEYKQKHIICCGLGDVDMKKNRPVHWKDDYYKQQQENVEKLRQSRGL